MSSRQPRKKELLLEKLQECLCDANADYTTLHKAVTRKMKALKPAVQDEIWKVLKPRAKDRSPSALTTALFEHIQKWCAGIVTRNGRRIGGAKHEALRSLLGTSFLACTPSTKRPASIRKVEKISPEVVAEIEDYGTNLLKHFMEAVLQSAHVYPSTTAKMLASFSSACLEDVTDTSLCFLSAKFICLYLCDLDDTKLNLVQFVATRQLKGVCFGILGKNCNRNTTRQKKSAKYILVDLIRTSKELNMEEKDNLVAQLGGIDFVTDITYPDIHEHFWNQYAGI